MSGKYKVRFHLGKGKHYRNWQIVKPNGEREFINPDDFSRQIEMFNCRLVNNSRTAKKIHGGECNKTVCSWIECSIVKVNNNMYETENCVELSYNPRKKPFWVYTATDSNADGNKFHHLFTDGNKVYVKE